MIPGEYILKTDDIEINSGKSLTKVTVSNTSDRPVQVGSHYHFYEVNPALIFDRQSARGKRLAIIAGTSVRFEPGQKREVELIEFGGLRRAVGFRGEVMGNLDKECTK
ncbi:MAG: urease subunit beta [Deltaproteobacteria bacterium]|jgi:urease subunit beta|nr:urease subunit beta [Deltaproteobacteria bacterium]